GPPGQPMRHPRLRPAGRRDPPPHLVVRRRTHRPRQPHRTLRALPPPRPPRQTRHHRPRTRTSPRAGPGHAAAVSDPAAQPRTPPLHPRTPLPLHHPPRRPHPPPRRLRTPHRPQPPPARVSRAGSPPDALTRPAHSHSMVPGGFEVMSMVTRLISATSLVIRVEIVSSSS